MSVEQGSLGWRVVYPHIVSFHYDDVMMKRRSRWSCGGKKLVFSSYTFYTDRWKDKMTKIFFFCLQYCLYQDVNYEESCYPLCPASSHDCGCKSMSSVSVCRVVEVTCSCPAASCQPQHSCCCLHPLGCCWPGQAQPSPAYQAG